MKELRFVGSSRENIQAFPEEVKDDIGYALYEVQKGVKPHCAMPLKGFIGAHVMELVENFDGNTYRAVYTVSFKEVVYVLHCFQKKSTRGIKTPLREIELIKKRFLAAQKDYIANY